MSADVVANLVSLHRSRMNFVSAKVKIELQIKAIQRGAHARAGCAKPTHATCPGVYETMTPDVIVLRDLALAPLRQQATARERAMLKECAALPAHILAFTDGTRGFGRLSLAQIVAEAGDLAQYHNPAKLWSRMGLGLAVDRSPRYEGRSPRRRAVMAVIGENFVKAGGPYKDLYDHVKEFERSKPGCGKPLKGSDGTLSGRACLDPEHGCCKPGHLHNRALRKVEKRLLLDLWRAWRGLPPRGSSVFPSA